jgi:hypothetical protein
MQKRRRFVGRGELREESVLASLQVIDLGLELGTSVARLDRIDDFLDVSFGALQITLRGTDRRAAPFAACSSPSRIRGRTLRRSRSSDEPSCVRGQANPESDDSGSAALGGLQLSEVGQERSLLGRREGAVPVDTVGADDAEARCCRSQS